MNVGDTWNAEGSPRGESKRRIGGGTARYLAFAPAVAQGSGSQDAWRRSAEHATATGRQELPFDTHYD